MLSVEESSQVKPLKPVIKWAGGKEKELKHILSALPCDFGNYYEPFVGGGSVFMAINADRYFVNDLSRELMSLYGCIANENAQFFEAVRNIDVSWSEIGNFANRYADLQTLYEAFRGGEIDVEGLKYGVSQFTEHHSLELRSIVAAFVGCKADFKTFVFAAVVGKLQRMKALEAKNGILPREDVKDNICTALKGGLYAFYRSLYNNPLLFKGKEELLTALFFFIRNYAYSGMFRYNDRGEFNVPYGGMGYNAKSLAGKLQYYKSPGLREHFKKTSFFNLDFEDFLHHSSPKENDFIFLDPPYDSAFSTYAGNDFTQKDQQRLAKWLICECKAKWMMIIKRTDFIYGLYANKGLNIRMFDKEYLVSFMNRNDKRAKHLLITNY